jgi:hypothetical protein
VKSNYKNDKSEVGITPVYIDFIDYLAENGYLKA